MEGGGWAPTPRREGPHRLWRGERIYAVRATYSRDVKLSIYGFGTLGQALNLHSPHLPR
jgi:hypothetical protein